MKTNYRILSSHFKYSNPGEYKIFYIGNEPKTNTETVDIYEENKDVRSEIDLMLIEDLTWKNEIQLNPEDTYAWLVVEIDDTYRFLKTITTTTEYNDVIVNYNGDVSKLVFTRILYDEIRGK